MSGPSSPFLTQRHDLIPADHKVGSADRTPAAGSFFAGAVQPGAGAFADSDSFLFGYRCEEA